MCEHEQTNHLIIPPDRAQEVLQFAGDIYLRDCDCRVEEQNCPKNEWEVCLLFEHAPHEDLYESRKISPREAEEILKITSQRNVVYTLFFTEEGHQLTELCSCCTCCCHPIRDKKQEGDYQEYLRSNYVAVTDEDLCIGCGACEPLCPFDAREVVDGMVQLADERCFGCGRCIEDCPDDAITIEYQPDRGIAIPRLGD
jgi:ferredoxin